MMNRKIKSDIGGQLSVIRNILTLNQRQFEHYEQAHLAKGTEEGRVKAQTNKEMAIKNDFALRRIDDIFDMMERA